MDVKLSEWRPGPNVCRCCFTEGCYKDISTEYFWMGKREVYAEMLSETFDLTISYSKSGGPNSNSRLICENCIGRLREASDFKRQVKECERTFIQHLDPGNSAISETAISIDPEYDKVLKTDSVKLEKRLSDDDFDDRSDFATILNDDDDDDLDDQPLMKLASRTLKKENDNVDILDLLDNAKVTEKRKSSSKSKEPPMKKLKKKEQMPKPSASKTITVEKKKKGFTSELPSTSRGASGPLKGKLHAPSSAGLFMTKPSQILNPRLHPVFFKSKQLPVKTLQIPRKGLMASNPPKILTTKNQSFRLVSPTLARPQIPSPKKPPPSQLKLAMHFYQPKLSPRQCAEIILKYSTACPFRSSINVFHCKFCSDHYLDPALLRKHYMEEHKGVNLSAAFYRLRDDYITIDVTDLKCKICQQDIVDLETLLKHLKEDHKKSFILEGSISTYGVIPFKLDVRNWKCIFCSAQFNSFVHLHQHVPSHLSNYVCDSCGAGFISHRLLNNHIRLTHSSSFPCHRCKATFQTLEERKDHIKTQHNPQPYTCYACKDRPRFSSWYVRLKHLQEVHDHKPMKYECVLCKETFVTRTAKYSHIRKVHTEPQQRCTSCAMVFHTKTQLKYHMVKHSDERPYKCNVCQKDFNRKKTLTQHMRIHTNDRRYVCHMCSQAFIQKCSLNNHLKVHHPA